MKKLSNTEAELEKSVAYKKNVFLKINDHSLKMFNTHLPG